MRGLFCWLLFAPALPSMCHQPVRRYCMARLYLQKAEPPFRRQPLECALLARELVERTIKSQGRFDTQRAQGSEGDWQESPTVRCTFPVSDQSLRLSTWNEAPPLSCGIIAVGVALGT